jgi:TolB-like protein/Tfp pilus assembly protein PilF
MNEQTFELVKVLGATLAIIFYVLGIAEKIQKSRAWKSAMTALHGLKTKWEGYRIPAITYSFRYEVIPIVSVSLFLNVAGWGITSRNPSILYLDMTGTAATSFLLGPWWGAIVGILTNIINATVYPKNSDVVLAPWMLVNLTGGIFWGLMARSIRFRRYVRSPSTDILAQAKAHLWYLFWFGVAGAAVMAIAGATVSVAVGNDPLVLAPSEAFGDKIQQILKGLDDYIQMNAAIGSSEIAPNILSALLRWGVTTLRYIPDKTISVAVGLLTAKYMFPLFEESLLTNAKSHPATKDSWLTPATAILVYTAVFPWGAINSQPQLWLWVLPFVILACGCIYESYLGTKSQIVRDDRIQRVRRYIAARCQLVPDEAFGAIVVAVLISSLVFMLGLFLVGSDNKGTIGFSFLKAILAYLVGFYLLRISVRQWAARIFWESPQVSNRISECEESSTGSQAQIRQDRGIDLPDVAPRENEELLASENRDVRSKSSKTKEDLREISGPGAPEAAGLRLPKYSLAVALIGLFVVIGVGVRIYFVKSKKPINSIAVMPFRYGTDDREIESISDGMTVELISTLTRLQDLTVKPRDSVFGYKGKEYDVKKIGQELSVEAILVGDITLNGNNLRLHLDLIDVESGTNLWSASYDRPMFELRTLQTDISKDIAQKIRIRLSGNDVRWLAEEGTQDNNAYQSYLQGRFHWNKRTGDGLKLAERSYLDAIDRDPKYARAYAGLAETYVLFTLFGVAESKDSMPLAKKAAERALELGTNDPLAAAEAHVALGAYWGNYAWNQAESEKEFRLAIKINPKYETAHHWLGNMPLQAMGQFDKAIAAGRLAEALDPRSAIISADTGQNLFYARRYDEAISQFTRALEIDPNFAYTHYYLGATFHAKGMFHEAIHEYRTSLKLNEDAYVKALLIRSLVRVNQRDEALNLLNDIQKEKEQHYVQSVVFALAYGALGDKDKAFEWLDKGIKEREIYPAYYSVDPTYDDLKDDPRFKTLVQRVALAKIELTD